MTRRRATRFRCVYCGKLTAGRVPRDPWLPGDGSARYPRRHKLRDVTLGGTFDCPGNIIEAEWNEEWDST